MRNIMMRNNILILVALLICGCTRFVALDRLHDYNTTVYEPHYATGFRILANDNDSSLLALEVYRPDTMRIAIPRGGFGSLMCMSSTYVGALSTLGADSTIVAVSGKRYLTNRAVANRAVEVGYEGAMDYESILAAKPEMALIYGIGGQSPLAAKLRELSVPFIYISDFEEQSPLGRAEWLVAIGALAGKDGSKAFNEIAGAYAPESEAIASVMVNGPYSGSWFIPGSENYMSQLLHDAGGRLNIAQPDGYESRPVDLEQAIPALESADFWLFPGQVESLDQTRMLVPKARFSGEVWNQSGDFYETGASRPDLVVGELKLILNREATDSLRYFYRLK